MPVLEGAQGRGRHPIPEEASSLESFFEPKSLAIIEASATTNRIGYTISENMVTNSKRGVFKGHIYLVNPKHDQILREKCYGSVSNMPVVVEIPAPAVTATVEEAERAGAKAAIMISSGFAEIGNGTLEAALVAATKEYGIHVIGPNCLGIYDAYTAMDTLFLPEHKFLSDEREVVATPRPRPGSISFLTQSEAFEAAGLDYMAGNAMGIRGFVSYGNRCDVTEDELLSHYEKYISARIRRCKK